MACKPKLPHDRPHVIQPFHTLPPPSTFHLKHPSAVAAMVLHLWSHYVAYEHFQEILMSWRTEALFYPLSVPAYWRIPNNDPQLKLSSPARPALHHFFCFNMTFGTVTLMVVGDQACGIKRRRAWGRAAEVCCDQRNGLIFLKQLCRYINYHVPQMYLQVIFDLTQGNLCLPQGL